MLVQYYIRHPCTVTTLKSSQVTFLFVLDYLKKIIIVNHEAFYTLKHVA